MQTVRVQDIGEGEVIFNGEDWMTVDRIEEIPLDWAGERPIGGETSYLRFHWVGGGHQDLYKRDRVRVL